MHKGRVLFCVFLIFVATTAIYLALDWPFKAALFPLSVSIPLLLLAGIQLGESPAGRERRNYRELGGRLGVLQRRSA